MNDLLCAKHGIQKECMGGRNAHISNWYCPECEAEQLELAKQVAEAQENDTRTDEEKIEDSVAFILDTRIGGK